MKNNPEDFLIVGANLFSKGFNLEDESEKDKEIYVLIGKGKYFEDFKEYEEAIKYYSEADRLFREVHYFELKEFEEDLAPGEEIGEQVPEKRLRICKKTVEDKRLWFNFYGLSYFIVIFVMFRKTVN